MSVALFRNIGAYLVTATAAHSPAAAGSVTGPAIDRQDRLSGVLHLRVGDATGEPTAQAVSALLEHSSDPEAGWEPYEDAQTDALDEDGAETSIDVNLSGARRYVRAVVDVDLDGGSAPAIPVVATLILGPTSP